jgi:GT2 family glycosyltransferase
MVEVAMSEMQASLIIPVWNGETVIEECLRSLYANTPSNLLEVICVENNSSDASAKRIAKSFPQVRLLRQPVNLGFAGGVNVGIEAAQGDLFVLLNQDCNVHPHWLDEILATMNRHREFGIVGCTIYNPDGSINHTGAKISKPDVLGIHSTSAPPTEPRTEEYVTGALFAIRRSTRQTIGLFDEKFYPGYYEECDYCYRARRHGIETGYAPKSKATHLNSSKESHRDPVRYWSHWQHSRFRFVCKHFSDNELIEFLSAEKAKIERDDAAHLLIARLIASRATLRELDEIDASRKIDLGECVGKTRRKISELGFREIYQHAFKRAQARVVSESRALNVKNLKRKLSFRIGDPADLQARIDFLLSVIEHEL